MIRLPEPALAFWRQLSPRDRRLVAALALAAIAAAELLIVWPQRTKRLAVQAAVEADEQSRSQAEADRAQALASNKSVLTGELSRVESELRKLDASGARREPLASLMQRAVASHELTLRALRALPVQEIALDAPAAPDAAASAPEPGASAPAPTTVFRHRVELRLAGGAQPLLRRLDSLLAQLAPLKLERVRLAATADGEVEATLTMFTIAAERTWLEL